MLQVVIDTNVLYSALRSKHGASYRLISLLNSGKFEINLSVPLVIEHEDVLKRKIDTLVFTPSQIDEFINYLCLIGNKHEVHFLWRPLLKDPEDDMILELAIRANCQYIITYNKQDFKGIKRFGIEAVSAKEFLETINEIS